MGGVRCAFLMRHRKCKCHCARLKMNTFSEFPRRMCSHRKCKCRCARLTRDDVCSDQSRVSVVCTTRNMVLWPPPHICCWWRVVYDFARFVGVKTTNVKTFRLFKGFFCFWPTFSDFPRRMWVKRVDDNLSLWLHSCLPRELIDFGKADGLLRGKSVVENHVTQRRKNLLFSVDSFYLSISPGNFPNINNFFCRFEGDLWIWSDSPTLWGKYFLGTWTYSLLDFITSSLKSTP